MNAYCFSQLADHDLSRELRGILGQTRALTARFLACLAEFDERRLYAPAGYSSLYAYCVHELGLSEDAACRRIDAARAARKFPAILDAVADGRLHLSAVRLLAPKLTPENGQVLLIAAERKTKAQVEQLLAERFPRSDLATRLVPLVEPRSESSAPARVNAPVPVPGERVSGELSAPAPVNNLAASLLSQADPSSNPPAPARVNAPAERATPGPYSRVKPLAPQRFALQITISQETRDKLERLKNLLGHKISSGDLAQVLDYALDAALVRAEKTKFAATSRPRKQPTTPSKNRRHIPAAVRRAVRARDRDQCTFVSENGRHCTECKFLEFDHVEPVARGGRATVDNLRLRCRTHNGYAADEAFGAGFMARWRRRKAAKHATGDVEIRRSASDERGAEKAREVIQLLDARLE